MPGSTQDQSLLRVPVTFLEDAVPHPDRSSPSTRVAAMELIPGHAATEAEVLLFTGAIPGVTEHVGPWVVLRGDDWPMSATSARALAGALLRAAARVEAADRSDHSDRATG